MTMNPKLRSSPTPYTAIGMPTTATTRRQKKIAGMTTPPASPPSRSANGSPTAAAIASTTTPPSHANHTFSAQPTVALCPATARLATQAAAMLATLLPITHTASRPVPTLVWSACQISPAIWVGEKDCMKPEPNAITRTAPSLRS